MLNVVSYVCVCVLYCVVDGAETRTGIFVNTVVCSEKSLKCAEKKPQSRALCIPGPQSSPSVLLYMSHKTHTHTHTHTRTHTHTHTHTHATARNRCTTAELLRVEGGFRRHFAPQDGKRIRYEQLLGRVA